VLYGYDKMGRMSQVFADSGAAAGTTTLAYAAGQNRLASVTSAAGARSIAYDARGNTLSETRPGAVSAALTYDGHGRLTGYSRSDVGARTFAYNGLDDRVSMVTPITTRRFVYAADGRVMGEYGLSAADVKAEFIWAVPDAANDNAFGGDDGIGGYAPLAVATPNASGVIQINWVHGNHLGVPILITDSAGNPATTPNDYLAPGFPGQSQVLSDLYYNRYRDYDPTTGRYIQADPIGLAGGPNDYAYVGGNPVNDVDPMGLQQSTTCGPLTKLWYDLLKSAACNGPTAPRKCTGEMGEEELRMNFRRHQACVQARDDVINICYGGMPDTGHLQALTDSIRGRDNCAEKLRICRPPR
jgi:RHS repeat-associated protein